MSAKIYPNGTGGVLGDELITETELYSTGLIYYVHSSSGDDASSGLSRQKPLATLAHAQGLLAENDIVVLMDGHTETITATIFLNQAGLRIVGEGTVSLTSGLTNQSAIVFDDVNVAIGNIRFPAGGSLSSVPRIQINGRRGMIRGCYLEASADDQFALVVVDADASNARFFQTTFISVSTTVPPVSGVSVGSTTDCEFEACTFDGGFTGFSSAGLVSDGIPDRLRMQQTRLLNGAGITVDPDTTGYVGISENTGSPIVDGFARRLPNGFRQVGDALLSDPELYLSGDIFYVQYTDGLDANSGIDELNPKKTIANAVGVLSKPCSFIVCLPGHVEPLSAAIDVNVNGTTLIGCGTADGKPSCRIYQSAGGPFVNLTLSTPSYARNLWIDKTPTAVTQTEQVAMQAEYSEVRGCLVTTAYRDTIGILCSVNLLTVRETKCENGDTAGGANRATAGIEVDSESSVSDLDFRGCIFSNGTHGFKTAGLWGNKAITRLYGISNTLSFGADVKLNASTTGMFNPETASGSSLVTW